MKRLVFLGPQRHRPCVDKALDALGVTGPVALVSAGWQEREPEEDELGAHLDRPVLNLALYLRAEQAFARDGELFDALRAHQEELRDLQQLYRLRLGYALDAARGLMTRRASRALLEVEQDSAVESVRALDAHHVGRIRAMRDAFADSWRPLERDAVAQHRDAIAGILTRAEALLVAGGHVAVLLNRLRLFGIDELAGDLPVVAWSAGAMALSERVVLFHDSPPQGAGNAEVLDVGLGVAPGIVPLPHASSRLRLNDEARVGLFARRFAPARSIPLEEGTRIEWNGDDWLPADPAQELSAEGRVRSLASR